MGGYDNMRGDSSPHPDYSDAQPIKRDISIEPIAWKQDFLRLSMGDLQFVARMSMMGPVIVATLRDYKGGDLGWSYLSPCLILAKTETLEPGPVRRALARRPWSGIDVSYLLCRKWGGDIRAPLPGITSPEAAIVGKVFGMSLSNSDKAMPAGGDWLSYAHRWIITHPAQSLANSCEDYLPGWIAEARATAPAEMLKRYIKV